MENSGGNSGGNTLPAIPDDPAAAAGARNPCEGSDNGDNGGRTPCEEYGLDKTFPQNKGVQWGPQPTHTVVTKVANEQVTYKKTEWVVARIKKTGGGTEPSKLARRLVNRQGKHKSIDGDPHKRWLGHKSREDTVGHIIGNQYGGKANDRGIRMGNIFPQSSASQDDFRRGFEDPIADIIDAEHVPACVKNYI